MSTCLKSAIKSHGAEIGNCVLHGSPLPIRGLRAAERRIRRLFFFTVGVARGGDQAPCSHFFIKLVFAAPESGLPSLPTALLSQVSCARAVPPANATTNAANIIFLNTVLSLRWLSPSNLIPAVCFRQGVKNSIRRDGSRA